LGLGGDASVLMSASSRRARGRVARAVALSASTAARGREEGVARRRNRVARTSLSASTSSPGVTFAQSIVGHRGEGAHR